MFAVPRVPLTDFVLEPDSSGRGLIATWKAPDPTKVNGRITFYIIKFRKVGSQVENTTAIIEVCKHDLCPLLQLVTCNKTLKYGGAVQCSAVQCKCNALSRREKIQC